MRSAVSDTQIDELVERVAETVAAAERERIKVLIDRCGWGPRELRDFYASFDRIYRRHVSSLGWLRND